MKRNTFPMIAVILAIGLTAFSFTEKTESPKTLYYWYELDLQNNVIPQGAEYFAHEEDPTSPCPENSIEVDCIRGFDQDMDAVFASGPSTASGQVQKKTEDPND